MFHRAIEPIDFVKSELQVGADLLAGFQGRPARAANAGTVRAEMAKVGGLDCMANALHAPEQAETVESDMQLVEL